MNFLAVRIIPWQRCSTISVLRRRMPSLITGAGRVLPLSSSNVRASLGGGIEYDSRMYETCKRNLEALGLPTDAVVKGNAAEFSDVDGYDYFYLYNPFVGETFRGVIRQLEASHWRKPRVMTLIYSNPFCHQSVIEHGVFRWTKTIPADFYIPEVHVYQTKGE